MSDTVLDRIVAKKLEEIAAAKASIRVAEVQSEARNQPPPRSFVEPLREPGVQLIAEIKKASPSAGLIRADFDPPRIARQYVSAGAACLSVLTDETFFQGQLQFLKDVRATVDVPILRKDFVLDEYQLFEARAAGADAVLLIAECLSPGQLADLHGRCCELGMTPLVELYRAENLPSVLACGPSLVGVNNRDLATFQTELEHSLRLRPQVPKEILFVSESGIRNRQDVERLAAAGVDAMLVGESLMRCPDVAAATRSLLGH